MLCHDRIQENVIENLSIVERAPPIQKYLKEGKGIDMAEEYYADLRAFVEVLDKRRPAWALPIR